MDIWTEGDQNSSPELSSQVSLKQEVHGPHRSPEEEIWNIFNIILLFSYLHKEKGMTLHLYKFESPLPKDSLCQVLLNLTQWFCKVYHSLIISPYDRVIIWTNFNPLYQGMHCAKFVWNWPSGSGEEKDENVESLQQRRQKNFDQKSSPEFFSGELKKIHHIIEFYCCFPLVSISLSYRSKNLSNLVQVFNFFTEFFFLPLKYVPFITSPLYFALFGWVCWLWVDGWLLYLWPVKSINHYCWFCAFFGAIWLIKFFFMAKCFHFQLVHLWSPSIFF